MAGKSIDLNGDDMWDDSALVVSWNEALDEYKKYHSIHAKGGSIKELQALSASRKPIKTEEDASGVDDVAMEEDQGSEQETSQAPKQEHATPEAASSTAPAISPPEAVLGSVRDENLKKLLMSWYYAGYYTGLHEGQQQQQPQG